jgi:Trypsin
MSTRWISILALLLLAPACVLVPESGAPARMRPPCAPSARAPAGSPWLVAIRRAGRRPVCAGAVLDARHVLSARSCFAGDDPLGLLSPASFTVVAGAAQTVEVDDLLPIGDGYDGVPAHGGDLVVVRLARPLRLGGTVQAIELLGEADEEAGRLATGVVATVAGWAAEALGIKDAQALRSTTVRLLRSEEVRLLTGLVLADDLIAAMVIGAVGCAGNPGEPLVVRSGRRWILAGIAGTGPGACDLDLPRLYTSVARHAARIGEALAQEPSFEASSRGIQGRAGELRRFAVQVPAGLDRVEFELRGGGGELELLVRQGAPVSLERFDCSSPRACRFGRPDAGTYSVGVRGSEPYQQVELRVRAYGPPAATRDDE